jgi:hypothetical protein
MELAEKADNTPLAEGVDIPAEIARREERIRRLAEAQRAIEERHAGQAIEQYREALEKNLEETKQATEATLREKKAHRPPDPPEPPSMAPPDRAQQNFTDPDSRIMPDKGGFTQSYNAQLSVDTGTMMIVGHHVSQATNDKRELLAAIQGIDPVGYGIPTAGLADAGFFSAENIEASPIDIYISPGKKKHNTPLAERLLSPATGQPSPESTPAEKMRHKLNTETGRALYRLRKMTVEPAVGIIKQAMGFRQFHLRGATKVRGEWGLVCLAYNLKRLFGLKMAAEA